MFVSALGVLVSIAVLIAVIIKAKRNEPPPDDRRGRGRVIDIDPK